MTGPRGADVGAALNRRHLRELVRRARARLAEDLEAVRDLLAVEPAEWLALARAAIGAPHDPGALVAALTKLRARLDAAAALEALARGWGDVANGPAPGADA